jgi:dTDP-4-amino-4,6-dideoxygalactose transaminase
MFNFMLDNELAIFGGSPVKADAWPSAIIRAKNTEKFLLQALHSNTWAIGSDLNEDASFERRFAKQFVKLIGTKYCVPTISGTAALRLALLALDIKPNDKVIVPGLTWVACATSVLSVGAIPVLVDIAPDDLCLSLAETEKQLKNGCRAIMLVHLYNSSAQISNFVSLAKKYNVPLIEDCAQSIGTKVKGKNIGTFGDVACFSFHQSKELAAGEGGAIITNNKELFDKIELLRSDGMLFSNHDNKYYGNTIGHNMSLSEIHSAILCGQIEEFKKNQLIKESNGNYLKEILAKKGFYTKKQNSNDTKTSYFKFIIKLDLERFTFVTSNVIAKALSFELNTLVSPIYAPLNNNKLYQPKKYPAICFGSYYIVDPSTYKLPNAALASKTYISLHHNVLLSGKDALDGVLTALLKLEKNSNKLLKYKMKLERARRITNFNL